MEVTAIFMDENLFRNVICKMVAILSWLQFVDCVWFLCAGFSWLLIGMDSEVWQNLWVSCTCVQSRRVTHSRLLLQHLLSPAGRRCMKFGVRSCCKKKLKSVCTFKENIGGTSRCFTNIKLNGNMSRPDWKYSRLNQSKWTFSKQI